MKKIGFYFILFFVFLSFVSGLEINKNKFIIVPPTASSGVMRSFSVASELQGVSMQKFQYSNSFSAELTKEQKDVLLSRGYVVREDKLFSVFLQDSVPLIQANYSWPLQVSGINLTGTGQTVCIIDTGINYSHSDFGGCTRAQFLAGNCFKVVGGWDFVNNDNDPMDSNDGHGTDAWGHGTHVSGIVAANGSIKGVAPGAKIVALKAVDSANFARELDIVNAIEWCVNNASKFNISVISMSLGTACYNSSGGWTGDCYNNFCDSDFPDFAGAINAAVVKNISVSVASGNDGNFSYISAPACIANSTPVGATTKGDLITSYSNRNSLVSLFAPGSNINSTWYNGGYNSLSGTSMATPHVAGAIAILNELLNLTNRIKTPSQIESILSLTGKQINDSGYSNLNYSRINVLDAVLSLDNIAPNVSLVSPINNSVDSGLNQIFSCNASDWQLSNISFYLWNSSSLVYSEIKNITGTINSSGFNLTNINFGNYNWTCKAVDLQGNSFMANNFSFSTGGVFTILSSPANNSYVNFNQSNFSCESKSESRYSLSNISFYLWNSSGLVYNETKLISGFDNISVFNYSFSSEDSYRWACLSFNNNSNFSYGGNNSFIYDATSPSLNLTSPSNSGSWTSDLQEVIFNYSVFDLNLANCSLIVNDLINLTNSSINVSIDQSFVQSFSPGSYIWQINCSDLAGNFNSSELRSFVITAPCSGCSCTNSCSSGGGGGSSRGGGGSSRGGGGSSHGVSSVSSLIINNDYTPSFQEVSSGYSQNLKKDDKIKFVVFDGSSEQHILSVVSVSNFSASFVLQSTPIDFSLGIGQERKFNLSSQDYYDLDIKLENIVNDSVLLKVQVINEPINKTIINLENREINNIVVNWNNSYFKIIVLLVLFIFIIFLVLIKIFRKSKIRKEAMKELSN